jgi:hypothetical protein
MTVALSYERRLENALVSLLAVNSEIVELGVTVLAAWESDKKRQSLAVVVHCGGLTNANLAATGGGAYWSATVNIQTIGVMAAEATNDTLDRCHGACERFWASLTTSTLNTAIGSGITVYGIVGPDGEDEQEVEDGILLRKTARLLHFGVS